MKKDLFKESLVETWRDVLASLKLAVEEVSEKGADMIPRVDFNQIKDGRVDDSLVERIKRTGTCVIEGGVPLNQALGWEKSILEYVDANEDKVKGFPQNDIQVYEFYNSIAQTEARAHPNLMASQKFLLGLLHSTDSQSEISLQTPISYFDRVQHRKPDDE